MMFAFMLCSFVLHAQAWDEWFRQNKTQKKYLIQQIAALEVYKGYLQKGYSIAKGGLKVIGDVKNGEFSLHKAFFNSLKLVNPKIKKYPRIADMMLMQANILKVYADCYRQVKKNPVFSSDDARYIYEVFLRLLKDCEEAINELIDILTDGRLEMKDDERIERIDRLYDRVSDMYVFVRHFATETLQLGAERLHEQQELNLLKEW